MTKNGSENGSYAHRAPLSMILSHTHIGCHRALHSMHALRGATLVLHTVNPEVKDHYLLLY